MTHTTVRSLDLLTATGAGNLPTALAAINGFIRATAGDVPDPKSITVYNFTDSVAIHFGSLDDLRNWAAYLQAPVTADDTRPQYDAIHHHAEAKWGPINGKMVGFRMVYVEDVPVHACSDDCDPGNCEVAHEAEFSLPRDCEAGEWS